MSAEKTEKIDVLSIEGKKLKEIAVPEVFNGEIDEVLIKRAVLSSISARIQPKGPNPRAGRNYTAEYEGSRLKPQMYRTINVGHARLPRMKNRRYVLSGQVALLPQAVHGTRVHALKKEKITHERINRKERRKAIAAAIAATCNIGLVKKRGHAVAGTLQLPIVVEKKIEHLEKTKDVKKMLEALNLWKDVERAKDRKHIRAGKGKRRGRKYKRAKSVLIVVENSAKVFKAARNLEGVDVTSVKNLNAELLAPGTQAGRLTVWSEGAIHSLETGNQLGASS